MKVPALVLIILAVLSGLAKQAGAQALQANDWISAIAGGSAEGFVRPSGPWELSLPAAHATHPDSRMELWQLTTQFNDGRSLPLGFQLSLLRIGLVPPGPAKASTTAWDAHDLYRGHVIFLRPGGEGASFAEERFGRGMARLAGYDEQLRELRLDNWSLDFDAGTDPVRWRLSAAAGKFAIDLQLTPVKPAVRPADQDAPFRGYALSRLAITGSISTPEGPSPLAGTGWFEHVWGELPVPGQGPVASDRLQLQLDDGSDIAIIRTRRIDGGGSPGISVTAIDGAGRAIALDAAAADAIAAGWPGNTATFPADWKIRAGDLDLALAPAVPPQRQSFVTPLWSGLVTVHGSRGGRPVTGTGTLQMTGYGLQ